MALSFYKDFSPVQAQIEKGFFELGLFLALLVFGGIMSSDIQARCAYIKCKTLRMNDGSGIKTRRFKFLTLSSPCNEGRCYLDLMPIGQEITLATGMKIILNYGFTLFSDQIVQESYEIKSLDGSPLIRSRGFKLDHYSEVFSISRKIHENVRSIGGWYYVDQPTLNIISEIPPLPIPAGFRIRDSRRKQLLSGSIYS